MKELQLIIDCDSVAHAAFHTLGDLSYRNQKTGVMFGFLLRVVSLAKKFETGDVVFCWDSNPKYSKRKEIYPHYKERRHDRTEEEQVRMVAYYNQTGLLRKEVLPSLGFSNVYHRTGYEADDLIAAVVVQNQMKKQLMIVSTDLDLLGCIGYSASFYNLHKKKVFDKGWFNKRYCGFDPWWWWEAKSISGCSSDGVKGIKGVADPAKTKASPPPVFRYLKGELKGKVVERIESAKGQMIRKRNRRLIFLPFSMNERKNLYEFHPDCKGYGKYIRYNDNSVTIDKLSSVFRKYRFRHFLKGENFKDWQRLFVEGRGKGRHVIVRGR